MKPHQPLNLVTFYFYFLSKLSFYKTQNIKKDIWWKVSFLLSPRTQWSCLRGMTITYRCFQKYSVHIYKYPFSSLLLLSPNSNSISVPITPSFFPHTATVSLPGVSSPHWVISPSKFSNLRSDLVFLNNLLIIYSGAHLTLHHMVTSCFPLSPSVGEDITTLAARNIIHFLHIKWKI